MSAEISKQIFTADTWPLKRWALTIIAAEYRVVCEIRDENGITETADHRCGDAEWAKLESLLAKCNFPAWREEYKEPVLDGTHWHLEIQYADGRATESDGMNGYPDEWRDFTAMCEYCEEISEGEFRQQL
jgi:hypothetical protein